MLMFVVNTYNITEVTYLKTFRNMLVTQAEI